MYPVFTFASGPTNSMRGAAFVSGLKDAIVVDVGGTSTDIGVLVQGFPRQAGARVLVSSLNSCHSFLRRWYWFSGRGSSHKFQNATDS